jgi:hypothetical protein
MKAGFDVVDTKRPPGVISEAFGGRYGHAAGVPFTVTVPVTVPQLDAVSFNVTLPTMVPRLVDVSLNTADPVNVAAANSDEPLNVARRRTTTSTARLEPADTTRLATVGAGGVNVSRNPDTTAVSAGVGNLEAATVPAWLANQFVNVDQLASVPPNQ